MRIKFPCTKCGAEISVKFLKTGERAICPKCKAFNAVPENAEECEELVNSSNETSGRETVIPASGNAGNATVVLGGIADNETLVKTMTILSWIVIISAVIGGIALYSEYSKIEYSGIVSGMVIVFGSLFSTIGFGVSKLFNTKNSSSNNENIVNIMSILSWLVIASVIISGIVFFVKLDSFNKGSFGLTKDLVAYGIIIAGIVISFCSLIGTIGLGVSKLLNRDISSSNNEKLVNIITILSWIVIISAVIGGVVIFTKLALYKDFSGKDQFSAYGAMVSAIVTIFGSLYGTIGLGVARLFNRNISSKDNEGLVIVLSILSWIMITSSIIGVIVLYKYLGINSVTSSIIGAAFVSLIGTIGLGVSKLLDLRLLFNQGQMQANQSDLAADIVTWLNENNKIVIGAVVLLIASFVVYYSFIKQDPVRDAKKAVAEYLECSEKNFEDRVKVDKEFIASFNSYNFKAKPDAYLKMNELQKSINQADSIRSVKADSYYKELQNRYANNKEKLRIFDSVFTVQKQQMLSKTSNNNTMYSVIDSLISTIKEPDLSSGTKNITMTFEGYSEGDYVHLIFKDTATGEEHDFRFFNDNNLCGIPILLDDNESVYGYKSNPAYLNKTFDVVIKEKEVLDSEDGGETLIKTTAWVISSLKLK